MKIINDKYIINYDNSGYDLLQVWLFNQILINKRVVNPLRKYLSKGDSKEIGIW